MYKKFKEKAAKQARRLPSKRWMRLRRGMREAGKVAWGFDGGGDGEEAKKNKKKRRPEKVVAKEYNNAQALVPPGPGAAEMTGAPPADDVVGGGEAGHYPCRPPLSSRRRRSMTFRSIVESRLGAGGVEGGGIGKRNECSIPLILLCVAVIRAGGGPTG